MKLRLIVIVSAIAIIVVAMVVALRPVPVTAEKNCINVKGIISEIKATADNDITIKLKDDKTVYYINRGIEQSLQLPELIKLISKEVTVKYPDYFSILDPGNSSRHISMLKYNEKTIFSEFK